MLVFSFCLCFFTFLDRIFRMYILLKAIVVECDCDVVGVSGGGRGPVVQCVCVHSPRVYSNVSVKSQSYDNL